MKRTTKRRLGLAGLVVASMLVVLFVASIRFYLALMLYSPSTTNNLNDARELGVHVVGGVALFRIPHDLTQIERSWKPIRYSFITQKTRIERWGPKFDRADSLRNHHRLMLPLWIPAFIVGIPSFLLWRRNPKLPEGHCECGYNLTGNVSGVCPECGTKLQNNGDEEITSAEDSAK